MKELIKLLDEKLECTSYKIEDKRILIEAHYDTSDSICPFCGAVSTKVHSRYIREIQDLPIQNKQVIILLTTRKLFCSNNKCTHKTFSERFSFISRSAKNTNRLMESIMINATALSSIKCSQLLGLNNIKISKSSICEMLKKNASYSE